MRDFRAWGEERKKWVPKNSLAIGPGGEFLSYDKPASIEVEAKCYTYDPENVVIEFFTGRVCVETNAKIYNGDIVEYRYPDTALEKGANVVMRINYVPEKASFMAYSEWYGEERIHEDVDLKLLGNIHEHPELEALSKSREARLA